MRDESLLRDINILPLPPQETMARGDLHQARLLLTGVFDLSLCSPCPNARVCAGTPDPSKLVRTKKCETWEEQPITQLQRRFFPLEAAQQETVCAK
jgi:hypothetical protein